jgi:hypothetical protein
MEDYWKEQGGGKIIKLADFVEYQQGSGEKIQDDAYDDQVQQLKQLIAKAREFCLDYRPLTRAISLFLTVPALLSTFYYRSSLLPWFLP